VREVVKIYGGKESSGGLSPATNLTRDGEVVVAVVELGQTGDFKSPLTRWLVGDKVVSGGKLRKCLSYWWWLLGGDGG
jgi:hypothetical protein